MLVSHSVKHAQRETLIPYASSTRRDPEPLVVVGASAAGLFVARELARRGRDVTLLEGAPSLQPAPRTLIVTHQLLELVDSLPAGVVVNEIRRLELFTDGQAATIHLRRPDLVIERAALVQGLAEQARAAGARILMGHRVTGLERSNGHVMLVTDGRASTGRAIEARAVVGADGAFSRVASAAGWPPVPTVPLVQACVRLPKDVPVDSTRVWFIPEETPFFYWLIPESPERAVVGLIGEEGRATRVSLERFLAARGLEPLGFQAARIPLYAGWLPPRRVGDATVYLVGDAAAHVKATTVGGIVTGFKGAAGVVELLLTGRSDQLRAVRRELERHRLIRRALHALDLEDYSRLLGLLGSRARRLLGRHTRDESHRILAWLLVAEPRILLMGVRSLLAGAAGLPGSAAGGLSGRA